MKMKRRLNKKISCCTALCALLCVVAVYPVVTYLRAPYIKIHGMLRYHDVAGTSYPISYDERSFIINNTRTIILSGSVHYPRSTPGMWDHIFEEMVKDGLNAVQVYVFWNVHEFKRGQEYDFSGSANLPLFIEKAAKAGLFVNLRVGPYVCAEWNYGGLPVWLNSIPGMGLRSNSQAWMKEMKRFVTDITKVVERYLARNGGPIILAQIENEYNWPEYMDYINWCGDLVTKLGADIPWGMCHAYGLSARDTINTFNGEDGQYYAQEHLRWSQQSGQPLVWTENQGWFQDWGMSDNGWSYRTPEDMAYAVLAWFARGGSHHNYYMWYGGNHMGRSAAMGITNKYADGVNLYSDMLPNEPKKTHLTRLHKLIKSISVILLSSNIQTRNSLHLRYYDPDSKAYKKGAEQIAFVYDNDVGQITFLQNSASMTVRVLYHYQYFIMQPKSIIVLNKAYSIIYDTSKVNSTGLCTKRTYIQDKVRMDPFLAWSESIREVTKTAIIQQHPLEQLMVTQDETDYLFYQTTVNIPKDDKPNYELKVDTSKANALLVFRNERFEGAADDHDVNVGKLNLKLNIQSNGGKPFNLTILSVSLGLSNVVQPHFIEHKGIVGKVLINGVDITNQAWLHRPKLTGEILQVYTGDGSKQVNWDSDYAKYINASLTWFKTTFTVEEYPKDYSLLLHLVGFGRGHFYVNGVDLGRYWLIRMVNSLKYVQEYYFIPPDIVNYNAPNLLVIGEELGAPDPSKATLVLSTMTV